MAAIREVDLEASTITLELLENTIVKTIPDVQLVRPELRSFHNTTTKDMLLEFRAYILADHAEHKSASYTHQELPWWLKWASRWVRTTKHQLTLDAYYTYPQSNRKLPDLGDNHLVFTKSDFRVSDSRER